MAKVYRDILSDSVFIENPTGTFFTNQLKAIAEADGTVTVRDEVRTLEIMSHLPFNDYKIENGDPHGTDQLTTVDSLNAVFTGTGSVDPRRPEITSSTVITVGEGNTINYTLEATRGVFYQYSGLPDGIVNEEGNVRHIIGGSNLIAGTYVATMKAINYYGEDEKDLTIVVSDSPFVNAYSTNFSLNDRAQTGGLGVENVLGRTGAGAGTDDAWSISTWIKPSNVSGNQKFFSFGDNTDGEVALKYSGNATESFSVHYGDADNYITLTSADNTVPVDDWSNLMITYDGGTTGFSGGKFDDVVVGGDSLENPSFDTNTAWSLTNAVISGGSATLGEGEARVAQSFRGGEGLLYDASVNYKGSGGGNGRSSLKVYRYNSSTSLDDAKAGILNGFGVDVDVTELQLNSQNVSGTSVAGWLRRITINESAADGILVENARGKVYVFDGLLDLPAGTTDLYVRSDAGFEFTFNGSVVSSFDGGRPYGTATAFSINVPTAGRYPFSVIYYCSTSNTGGFLVSTDAAGNDPVNFDNLLVRPTLTYANLWRRSGVRNMSSARNTIDNDEVDGRFYVNKIDLPFTSSGTTNQWFNSSVLHREDIDSILSNGLGDKVVEWYGWLDLPAGTTELFLRSDDGFEFMFDGSVIADFQGERAQNSTPDTISIVVATEGVYPFKLAFFNGSGTGGLRLATDIGMTTPVSTANILVTTASEPRELRFKVFDSSGTTVNSVDFTVNDVIPLTQTFQFSVPFSRDLFASIEDLAYTSNVTLVEIEDINIIASKANNLTYVTDSQDFYTRFKGYIDGVEVPLTGDIRGNGWEHGSVSTRMFLGEGANGIKVDELALYDSRQPVLAPDIYNSKMPVDLTELTTPPNHWWRMGDGDTFPILQDNVGTADLTMINMSVADIVNDVPTDGSVPPTTSAGSSPIVSFNVTADGTASSITIIHSQGRLMSQAQLFEPDGTVSELHLVNTDENTSVVSSSTPMLGTITLT